MERREEGVRSEGKWESELMFRWSMPVTVVEEARRERSLVWTGAPWWPCGEQTESKASLSPARRWWRLHQRQADRGAEGWVHPGHILRVNPPSMADLQRKKPTDFCLIWSCHFRLGEDGGEGPRSGVGESGPQIAGAR